MCVLWRKLDPFVRARFGSPENTPKDSGLESLAHKLSSAG